MKEFSVESVKQVRPSVLMAMGIQPTERRYPAYIGLDVHKESIVWAIAWEDRSEPE